MHNVKVNIINLKVNKLISKLIIYMEEICHDIKEDLEQIEADTKKINCGAILDLIKHCIKCFMDSLKCCFKFKVE